jgi:hypothetical protein
MSSPTVATRCRPDSSGRTSTSPPSAPGEAREGGGGLHPDAIGAVQRRAALTHGCWRYRRQRWFGVCTGAPRRGTLTMQRGPSARTWQSGPLRRVET